MARERAAHTPLDSFCRDTVVNAEALEYFERALRVADASGRGALHADGVVLVEQDRGHAVAGEAACHREPCKTATDDDDGIVAGFTRFELRRRHERVLRQRVARALRELIAVRECGLRI